ncbi:MAG: histidine kinase dimerization/phospho-acceptor domain-containing protein [Planctomycetota bacterium]|jgi:hypothetical protein
MVLYGPRWVSWALAFGLLVFLAAVLWVVWSLDMRVTEDALAHHGKQVESQLEGMVQRLADEEFASGGGGLEGFTRRLVDAADHNPGIRDLRVVRPGENPDHPCLLGRTLGERSAREHAAGELETNPVGCIVMPVRAGGARHASALLHVPRDWAAGGKVVQSAVRQTAWQLAPVFIGFYLLLGVMLVAATRTAERWRGTAVQAQRVEAPGALATGINHEIKNPLNALGLCLQVMERRHGDRESQETLAMAQDQSRQIAGTLDEFARFTRVMRLDLAELDLGAWMRQRHEVSGEASACVDPDKMKEALDSIVDLLTTHAPAGEPVQLRLGAGARNWRIHASAAAPDLNRAAVAHLFDPYVRTRPRDIGRGLAWAQAVFQAHGGDLTAAHRGGRLEVSGQAAIKPGV